VVAALGSKEDLVLATRETQPRLLAFRGERKKEIAALAPRLPGLSRAQTVVIDDDATWSSRADRRNLLFVPRPHEGASFLEQNRLALVAGVLERASELVRASPRLGLRAAVARVQRLDRHARSPVLGDRELYAAGARLLKHENPRYRLAR
jgi:hypothetical protein